MVCTKVYICDINTEDRNYNQRTQISFMPTKTLETEIGAFYADKSGLLHYRTEVGSLQNAIIDAIEHWTGRPTWFWHLGTPAPMHPGDTSQKLQARWSKWRDGIHKNRPLSPLFVNLKELAGIK